MINRIFTATVKKILSPKDKISIVFISKVSFIFILCTLYIVKKQIPDFFKGRYFRNSKTKIHRFYAKSIISGPTNLRTFKIVRNRSIFTNLHFPRSSQFLKNCYFYFKFTYFAVTAVHKLNFLNYQL